MTTGERNLIDPDPLDLAILNEARAQKVDRRTVVLAVVMYTAPDGSETVAYGDFEHGDGVGTRRMKEWQASAKRFLAAGEKLQFKIARVQV